MIKSLAYILTFFILFSNCRADIPAKIKNSYRHIVLLIKEGKANELAAMIEYPLKRENPLPNITSPKQFISYFSILFDSAFKTKLLSYNDSDIIEHNGKYGL